MKNSIYILTIIALLWNWQCKQTETEKLPIKSGIDGLDFAIQGAGGWDKWIALDTLRFSKITKLYHPDGTLEDSTFQYHTYAMYPEMTGFYTYEKEEKLYSIKYDAVGMKKSVGNEAVDLSEEEAKKLKLGFLGAQFVMCLPFKLLDEGVVIKEEEGQLLEKDVYILKATYNEKYDNHTKSHDWWHYIDKESGKHLGYKVYHAPTYAQVLNVSTTEIEGITFPTYRQTYRVTEDDKREYLRGEFWYEYQ